MSEKLSEKEIEDFQGDSAEEYPVMPLRNTVLFPQQVIPIYIGRDRSLKLINDLDPNSRYIVVVAQEDGAIEDPKSEDLYSRALGLNRESAADARQQTMLQLQETKQSIAFDNEAQIIESIIEKGAQEAKGQTGRSLAKQAQSFD